MLTREPTQPALAFFDPRAVAKCQRLGKGGCLQALSSGEKDGSGGPEERPRRVEGHHHAGL